MISQKQWQSEQGNTTVFMYTLSVLSESSVTFHVTPLVLGVILLQHGKEAITFDDLLHPFTRQYSQKRVELSSLTSSSLQSILTLHPRSLLDSSTRLSD